MATQTDIRLQFFDLLFGEQEGYACIATTQAKKGKDSWSQQFFEWPKQRKDLNQFIEKIHPRRNVYFSVNLFDRPTRSKDYALPSALVWGDFDSYDPREADPKPGIVLSSSPGRYQALWHVESEVDPFVAEEYSKRLAYMHRNSGADVSGWDIGQMLRVPFTFNYKYDKAGEDVPQVELLRGVETRYPLSVFEQLPQVEGTTDATELGSGMPDPKELPDPSMVLYKYQLKLRETAFDRLYYTEPEEGADWSNLLWRFINICYEAGMADDEVFSLALHSAVNKYERDNRPASHLWREVRKAGAKYENLVVLAGELQKLEIPLLTELDAPPHKTIVDDYIKWASSQTDAVPEFHELAGFILLSAMLAEGLRCYASFGMLIPNIWGMILGDSTLTRKTTASEMMMNFVIDIDSEMMLATDGSAEGLLTGLSQRPKKTSIFRRDEVAGFMEQINKRDYLAGMPEVLSALYDSPKKYSRLLRKETITVTNPIFIFFGSGIRDQLYQQISEHHISSGFLPRFMIVSGETDMGRLRKPGPATPQADLEREALQSTFQGLHNMYCGEVPITIPGANVVYAVQETQVFLTEKAWATYGEMEEQLEQTAYNSPYQHTALPTFGRMARSLLKMAMLSGASRREPQNNTVEIDEDDIVYAAWYVQRWGRHSVDLLMNAGRSVTERALGGVLRTIEKKPGILRSDVMRFHHLTKRDADIIFQTLEERAHIVGKKEGRGVRYWTV